MAFFAAKALLLQDESRNTYKASSTVASNLAWMIEYPVHGFSKSRHIAKTNLYANQLISFIYSLLNIHQLMQSLQKY